MRLPNPHKVRLECRRKNEIATKTGNFSDYVEAEIADRQYNNFGCWKEECPVCRKIFAEAGYSL